MNITLVATDRDVTRACTHLLPAGISTHVMALARGQVDLGHEVTLLTGRDLAEGVDLSYRHESGGGLRVVRLTREAIHAVTAGEGRVGRDVAAALEAADPDLIHAHGLGGAQLARDAASAIDVPWIAQLHDVAGPRPARTPDDARMRRAERDVVRDADHLVALCRDEAGHLVAAGARPDAIDVVPRAYDPSVFDVRGSTLPRSKRLRVVGVVDDFGPTSGLTELVRAVSRVPDVNLLVVGGPAQGTVAADQGLAQAYLAARQLGVSERMHVAGRLSPMRMAEHFRSADVVVSVPWAAGFSDHVLEAMACGRPVIASATGGALDTIEHGVTGLCVPPQNPQRLTDALRLLLCDRDQREQMGQLARRRVVEGFSLAHVVDATLDSYRRTLSRSGRRARAS